MLDKTEMNNFYKENFFQMNLKLILLSESTTGVYLCKQRMIAQPLPKQVVRILGSNSELQVWFTGNG